MIDHTGARGVWWARRGGCDQVCGQHSEDARDFTLDRHQHHDLLLAARPSGVVDLCRRCGAEETKKRLPFFYVVIVSVVVVSFFMVKQNRLTRQARDKQMSASQCTPKKKAIRVWHTGAALVLVAIYLYSVPCAAEDGSSGAAGYKQMVVGGGAEGDDGGESRKTASFF